MDVRKIQESINMLNYKDHLSVMTVRLHILQQTLSGIIKNVQIVGTWFVLVVESKTKKTSNSRMICCKMKVKRFVTVVGQLLIEDRWKFCLSSVYASESTQKKWWFRGSENWRSKTFWVYMVFTKMREVLIEYTL